MACLFSQVHNQRLKELSAMIRRYFLLINKYVCKNYLFVTLIVNYKVIFSNKVKLIIFVKTACTFHTIHHVPFVHMIWNNIEVVWSFYKVGNCKKLYLKRTKKFILKNKNKSDNK
jgi:hypothetical protein